MKNGPENYASDKTFAEKFSTQILSDWRQLQSDRTERENRWQDHYDAWSCGDTDPNNNRNYRGRSNIQLPQLRKETETMSRRLLKAMFPDDYLKGDGTRFQSDDTVILNTMVLRHFFDKVMKIKSKMSPFIKQGVLYGTSPMRIFWKKEENEIFFRKRLFKPGELGEIVPTFKNVKELITTYEGPKVQTCDMFNTWVYPITASDPSEVERVYHRSKVTFEQLKERQEKGISINVDFLLDEGKKRDAQFDQTQMRMQSFGEAAPLLGNDDDKSTYFDLLEVWGRAKIDGKVIPYVCEIINEKHTIRIQQNPLWHQSPPFIWMRYILAPGKEFYGRGLPEASIPVQHQLNDTLNQTVDSATLALNAITVINPAYAPNAASFEVEPNAIWWADPSAIKQFTFPDLSQSGMANANLLRQIITEMSDNSPQLPDPIAGKARSTGQAQLAMDEWTTDIYAFVDQVCTETMAPLAMQVHSLLQQNLPDDAIIRISGKYADKWINSVVTPDQICGHFDFNWLGAIQVENQAVKTQQMLNFLKIYPMLPPDAQVKLNWDYILVKLLRDGFNIRDVENAIQTKTINNGIPAPIENRIMQMGGDTTVHDIDDDITHIQSHKNEMGKEKDLFKRSLFQKHINDHLNQIKEKKDKQAMIQQMQQMQQQQALIAQATKQPGRPSANGSPVIKNPSGNQGQLSQSTSESDMMKGLS